jgi:DNA-directed RNA polymerase alpha subunit
VNDKKIAAILRAVADVLDDPAIQELPEYPPTCWSVRLRNCLLCDGIDSWPELLNKHRRDLLDIRNFGMTALTELEDYLQQHGLSLRTT